MRTSWATGSGSGAKPARASIRWTGAFTTYPTNAPWMAIASAVLTQFRHMREHVIGRARSARGSQPARRL